MGDLIMSGPAIRALKETYNARITVLTSSMAAGIAPAMSEIDEVIVFDLPWVKAKQVVASEAIFAIVEQLKSRNFDAAVIFTVFSQNPLPAAILAYMAAIPRRLAYCRENPYELLTDWVPDAEPYAYIQHQVERDLKLVERVGAVTEDDRLILQTNESARPTAVQKLEDVGITADTRWVVFHPGVSEKKREYPEDKWIEAAKLLVEKGYHVVLTGAGGEREMCDRIAGRVGEGAVSVAGAFNLSEFVSLVKTAPLIVSVNTGTVHIAAAVGTPVVVLYAETNPQHTPWRVRSKVLDFGVEESARSKNEVLRHLYTTVYSQSSPIPSAADVCRAVIDLLKEANN